MKSLFRPEAVEWQRRRLAGDVILAMGPGHALLTWIAIGIIAASVTFAATATYARKELVQGWLTPDGGIIRLVAKDGGTVKTVYVSEGEQVQAGEPVAALELSSPVAAGDYLSTMSRSLTDQADAADDRSAAQRSIFAAEQEQLLARRKALALEIGELRRQIALQQERIQLAKSEVDRTRGLAERGYASVRDLDARRSAVLAAEQQASALTAAKLGLEREDGQMQARLRAIPLELDSAEADARATRSAIGQQQTQAEAQSTNLIVAPVAGTVAVLPAQRGQAMPAGGTVAVVTPKGSLLEGELYVPSRAVGFLREGQEVRLMYEAFPHQKYGVAKGVVSSVSRSVLSPSDVTIPGIELKEPVFRVRVKLNRSTITAYGKSIRLQPGLLFKAEIVIDRRTLLEWLFDPLFASRRMAA